MVIIVGRVRQSGGGVLPYAAWPESLEHYFQKGALLVKKRH